MEALNPGPPDYKTSGLNTRPRCVQIVLLLTVNSFNSFTINFKTKVGYTRVYIMINIHLVNNLPWMGKCVNYFKNKVIDYFNGVNKSTKEN